MNARDLVNRLLEANQPSAGDNTGVYIFGPNLPNRGYNAPDMLTLVRDLQRYRILRRDAEKAPPEQVMDYLVRAGYTIFLKRSAEDVEVIGRVPAQTTAEEKERAAQYLGLDRKQQIQHRATPTATPKPLNVDYALFGSKELEREQREQEKQAVEQSQNVSRLQRGQEIKAKRKRSIPTQNLGRIDPKEQGWVNPPTGVGYEQDFMPLNAPVEVGFVYSASDRGIEAVEVVPGGPAAQAGLQAGDIITGVNPFMALNGEMMSGENGKGYGLTDKKHLEWVLRKADPNHALVFRVHRGGAPVNVPIQPQPKKAEQGQPAGTMHIPGEQVRDYFRKQRQPRGKRTGPVQRTFTRKLGINRPNDRTPAATTGNQPPNVSSLT